MKLMISVGKGERCMRLWNLVTGKKAGVLQFERGMLGEVGEGKFASGEGRKVAWGATTDGGEEFCVGFERGILVFGMDCQARCKVVPEPRSKTHQLSYVQVGEEEDAQVLAVSTEDGRILFYSTRPADLVAARAAEGKETPLPAAKLLAQLGGKDAGLTGRVKDFTVMFVGEGSSKEFIIVAASSDGAIRLWQTSPSDLEPHTGKTKQVGKLLGTYETGNRITCLASFLMLPPAEGAKDDNIADEAGVEDNDEASTSDSDIA